jgi:ribosomal protein S11
MARAWQEHGKKTVVRTLQQHGIVIDQVIDVRLLPWSGHVLAVSSL